MVTIGDSEDALNNVNMLSQNLCTAIHETASDLKLIKHTKARVIPKKPSWFDRDCRSKKNIAKKSLRAAKRHNFEGELGREYDEALSDYKCTIKNKQKEYNETLVKKLSNTKNGKEFWGTLGSFKLRSSGKSQVNKQKWVQFYDNIYPPREEVNNRMFYGVLHPVLDREITLLEFRKALKDCKSNKSPGADAIPNEFYKALPINWELYILCLFNKVLRTEVVPDDWSRAILTMIYKKGDPQDPGNYRGIALLNHITKLFTRILASRLIQWMEECGIIPEGQAGFRIRRACLDNVFVLQEIIHSQLRKEKGNLFVAFVDFKRAFDAVNHEKLWVKLLKLGVSAKMIRIMKNLYDKAVLRVNTDEGLTDDVRITEGVLQGEILSPLLFILYISDIDDYFRSRDLSGIDINNKLDVMILLYADDLAIVARNKADLRTKLKALRLYCLDNDLIVNESKTQILYCRKKGRYPKRLKFFYGDVQLKVVKSYIYLGIPFSSSGLGRQAMVEALTKTTRAAGAMQNLIYRAKMSNINSINTLFDSLVSSVALYACPVWALRYITEIETLQARFYKSILNLNKSTAQALVCSEMGRSPLSIKVWKLTWNWLVKILRMPNYRLPLRCLKNQIILFKNGHSSLQYNWVAQIFDFIDSIDVETGVKLRNSYNWLEWRRAGDVLLEKYEKSMNDERDLFVKKCALFAIQCC